MTLDSYIQSLRGKSIAVIGLGVSNRPLLRLLLDAGYTVTVRDKRTREALGEDEAAALEAAGCRLVLGDGYLAGITEDVIFRTRAFTPLRRSSPRPKRAERFLRRKWRRSLPSARAASSP